MKKLILILFVLSIGYAQNSRINLKTLPGERAAFTLTTYANSQTDTVVWFREPGVSAISFIASYSDSVLTDNDSACFVRRIVDNTFMTRIANDSLTFSSQASTASTFILMGTPTYAPYPDAYAFIVKYAATGNGTSTPSVLYKVEKVYSK